MDEERVYTEVSVQGMMLDLYFIIFFIKPFFKAKFVLLKGLLDDIISTGYVTLM